MWEYQGGGYISGVPTRDLSPEEFETFEELLHLNLQSTQPLYVWRDTSVQSVEDVPSRDLEGDTQDA